MAKAGRIGGGRMGRRGARVGLPRDAVSREPASRDPVSRDVAPRDPRHGGPPFGDHGRTYPAPPPPPLGAGWPDDMESARAIPRSDARHEERLAVARLFDHLDREAPRPYREDAYQDAPRIAHTGRMRFSLTGGSLSALIAGGVVSLFLIFVAGFMSAVVMFGEPDPDGQIAIRTTPAEPIVAESPVLLAPEGAPKRVPNAADPVVSTAEAGRDILPPPSPEILAAEQARDGASGRSSEIAPDTVPETLPETAPVRPVDQAELAPAPVIDAPQVSTARTLGPEGRVDGTIIFPADKPAPPTRQAAADPVGAQASSGLGPPGGNYSLQFGAFQGRDNAEALVRELSAAIDAGIVEEIGATGATLYHVRAGAFETRADALRVVRSLRDEAGFVTFVHANRVTG